MQDQVDLIVAHWEHGLLVGLVLKQVHHQVVKDVEIASRSSMDTFPGLSI